MNFVTNLIKLGWKLSKLITIEYFNIDGMGADILNIQWGFIEIKICFIKVFILIKLVYFGGNDCLSLELKDYKKNL